MTIPWNIIRAVVAGILLTGGACILAAALGSFSAIFAVAAVVIFAISAAMFAALGNWRVEWGMRASSVACIVGVILSIAGFGIILAHDMEEKQRVADLAVVDPITAAQVDDAEVAAARARLLGGDDAEATLRDAADLARADAAVALATEVLNPATTNPQAKEVQALIAARNVEVAEVQAKGYLGMTKEFFAKRTAELSHLGARIDAASGLVGTIYLVPTVIVVLSAIAMTLYAAGQFGLSWGLKDPGSDAKLGAKVTYWFNRTILAPSTKFAVGAFALAWFPFWWADAILEAYVPPAPIAIHAPATPPPPARHHASKPARPQPQDAVAEACKKNRVRFAEEGLDLALLPQACR